MQIAFYFSGNPVHDRVMASMFYGCPQPHTPIAAFDFNYVKSDIAVVFGVFKSKVPISWRRAEIIEKQHRACKDVLILETGYIHRGDDEEHYYAAGFNGLNGRADFKNAGMPSDRASELGVVLKPRQHGEKILLCGQVPQDASVDHIDIVEWLNAARDEIKARTSREIVFKPHPFAKVLPIDGCSYSTQPLNEAIQDCHAVVTFNSNAAVEAVIEGVPVFTFDDGSMARAVSNRDWDLLDSPALPDRVQWLNDLAYTQWTPAEMREGKAWQHLLRDRT